MPAEPAAVPRKRSGFVLRAAPARTAVQMVTDKWLRRLGVGTVAITLLGTALIGAPTMLDVSNDLLAASTELVTPPEVPGLPPAQPAKVAPDLALPATPDILAPDVADTVHEKVTAGA